jgi:hypothetical protein
MNFFQKLGLFFKTFGLWLIIPVIVAVLIITGFVISRHDKDDEPTPEISQNFEPNVGRPEIVENAPSEAPPATTPTPEPTPTTPPASTPAPSTPSPVTPSRPAPISTTPVIYRNDQLAFTATLPADTKVYPLKNNEVTFAPASGGQYYTVSSFALTNETINSLEQQLKSSPSVTSTARTNIHGYDAILFKSPNIPGVGYAVLKGQRLYYITGNLTPQLLNYFMMI